MCQSSTNITLLEQVLSKQIKSLFYQQLGHQIDEINCNFFDSKLAIVIKNALTKAELLLIQHGHEEIAKKFRNSIEEIIQPELRNLIEEVTGVEITQMLFATHLDANCVSLIVLFDDNYNQNTVLLNPGMNL
ncbi:MAG: DUF2294 domain-containing protein [Nostocaceae cyanobacterium]|nr:DUF2294 domain-containing protein [Nostocaceae cyanobacterium]